MNDWALFGLLVLAFVFAGVVMAWANSRHPALPPPDYDSAAWDQEIDWR